MGIYQIVLLGYLGILCLGNVFKISSYDSQYQNRSQTFGALIGTGVKYGIILFLLLKGGFFIG